MFTDTEAFSSFAVDDLETAPASSTARRWG